MSARHARTRAQVHARIVEMVREADAQILRELEAMGATIVRPRRQAVVLRSYRDKDVDDSPSHVLRKEPKL